MATHRGSQTTRGWRGRAPKTLFERRELLRRCGAKAFLDPKHLKYPVMAKGSTSCAIDCQGLRAAKARAGQYHHRKLEAKAERKGKSAHCGWA
jgi:hypothetical protein